MKIGVIITSYNRPNYLQQCLDSVKSADLSLVDSLLIIDDCSNDPQTRRLIDDFELEGPELIKVYSKANRSIKGSLLFGLDLLFNGCNCSIVINLDGDAIVKNNFIPVLLELHKTFPDNIISGFNCLTKNKNGTERHKVLTQGVGFNTKASVGGINMLFNKENYIHWVKPALEKCIEEGGNWDHKTCLYSEANGFPIVCSVPSVVQHIGIESSMGHSTGGEPPDVADDFIKNDPLMMGPVADTIKNLQTWQGRIKLSDVTLVAADCVNLERVFKAVAKCTEKLVFEDVKIFTSLPVNEPRCETIIQIPQIKSKEEYSWWIMKELAKYISTSHILLFQYDGYILNPDAWDAEWLQYDYIGAPWEWYDTNQNGNGGFSLRSRRLMKVIAEDPNLFPVSDGLNTHKEEDHCICRIYRKYLEDNYAIKFAPIEVARKFSIEGWRSGNKTWTNEFGFHGHGLTNIKP